MLDAQGHYLNYSGCGNTFNCNRPVCRELIINSLRFWVSEMHVDGFRFDLAAILTRDSKGIALENPPLIEAITFDPILANVKLIAEPWDAAGLYQVGGFYTRSNRWSEWNDKYRDIVRQFMKGTLHQKGQFATRICGSQDLYGRGGSPSNSINFVTSHDGFTLPDLVSYNHKHTLGNGEENSDGMDENYSWNCGVEGPSVNERVISLRGRLMRNYHLALMISQGVPMLLMGDEYGHTKFGNNNTWCQDNELNWFLWDQLNEQQAFNRFYRLMIEFRKAHPILRKGSFLKKEDIAWHGIQPNYPSWGIDDHLVAFTLYDPQNGNDIYIAFYGGSHSITVHFPEPRQGKKWHWVIDTHNESPDDILEVGHYKPVNYHQHRMFSHSSLLLKALDFS
jgi:isoamylase/glycogen operon protein